MERMDKTTEGTYTVSVTHMELRMLQSMVSRYLNTYDDPLFAAEQRLQNDLYRIIDPEQED